MNPSYSVEALGSVASARDRLLGTAGRRIVVWLTDTDPYECRQNDSVVGLARARAQLDLLRSHGVYTVLVGLAPEVSDTFLSMVSDAGGLQLAVRASSPAELTELLDGLMAGLVCSFPLAHTVREPARCLAEVIAGTERAPCDGAEGYGIGPDGALHLSGAACDRYAASAALSASAPCDALLTCGREWCAGGQRCDAAACVPAPP